MKQTRNSWTKKAMGLAAAFGLTFAMACATTDDGVSDATKSDSVAAGQTADPLGPPDHIDSAVGQEFPSSNTGTGNMKSSGSNTNLNPRPTPEPEVRITQSDAVITQTPIVEVRTAEVQATTVVEEDEEPVRRVTRKE